MNLLLQKSDLNDYLKSSDIIDYDSYNIIRLAGELSRGMNDETAIAKRVYEFVRDEISHSGDINASRVTCSASEVLEYKHGICCAKAHLFAALLRCLGIPAGFCYQWLQSDNNAGLTVIHGLNAVYFKGLNRWIRLDARGNKAGVDAQFRLDEERLAWTVNEAIGEKDDLKVYCEPRAEVIQALRSSPDRSELFKKWQTIR